MVHRARSAFEVDGLRKEMGGGKKRRSPSEEMRTVASFSTVSSSPSTSVTYRKSTKAVLKYKYTNAECENRRVLFLSPEHTCRSIPQSFFSQIKLHWNITTRDKNKPLPFKGDPWRVWWREQVCVTKASSGPLPIGEEFDVQKEGQTCAVCKSLDPSFEAASVFQQLTTFRWDCGILWAE